MIGKLVGGYRVVTERGRGPTGTVFYAEHPTIGRRAAIKVIAPELSDEARLDQFLTHLKVTSGIRHPNIVDVLDIGRIANPDAAATNGPAELTFVVMEMLEGESLDERFDRMETVEVGVAVRLLVQIASALSAAHDRGLVHAALKPSNVFITNSVDYPDFVKLLDFGATILRPQPDESLDPYRAPELLLGAPPSAASDLYAVGVLAYEMLAGAPPFGPARGITRRAVDATAVPSRPALPAMPLAERRPGIGRALSDVIACAMAPDAADRWPDVRELRRAVERAVSPVAAPNAAATSLPRPAPPATDAEVRRVERVQARKVGKALSTIILRRMNENRLQLPTMPLVALKALDVLRDPNATFADVARVLEPDPVIAARVLRVVNSAAYSRRDPVTTLERAVSQIGIKPMRILLVELAACQVFTSKSAGIRQTFKQIWEHCLAVGLLSRDLAIRLASGVDSDLAYLAGLLHDIGKPVVAGLLTETLWKKTVAEAHRGVGAAIAATWQLPVEISRAITDCDAYDQDAGPNACANLVRFANALTKREGIYVGDVGGDEIVAAILQGRSVLGVDEATEATLIATLRERTSAAAGGPGQRGRTGDRARRARFS